MVSVVQLLFGVIACCGFTLLFLSYWGYDRWEQVGGTALVAFVFLLGFGSLLGVVLGAVFGPGSDPGMPLWAQVTFLVWSVAAIPWLLFVLQYTGRIERITGRTVGLLLVPMAGIMLAPALHELSVLGAGVTNVLASVGFIIYFGVAFLGGFLLAQATHSYVHLSGTQGAAIGIVPIMTMIGLNSVGILQGTSVPLATAAFALTLLAGTALLVGGLVYRPLLEATPAVETVGQRAILRESDDPIFVVDTDEIIVECNETARASLAGVDEQTVGEGIEDCLGMGIDSLQAQETVGLDTTGGTRQYDPQVSPIRARSEEIGAVLSLRDVTDRELREQRLAVLNRVLRHNLRNKVEVVKSHAEVLGAEHDSGHADAIIDSADAITELGQAARDIDQFVSDTDHTTETNVREAVLAVLETHDTAGVDVELELAAVVVETNPQALRRALDSAIENAIEYADSRVRIDVREADAGCRVEIVDDGPGIPANELDSLDAGTETPLQHGTGLGLWQLAWAVRTMGGELSFDTSEGTRVSFTVPGRVE